MTNKELQEQNTRYARTIEQLDKDVAHLEVRVNAECTRYRNAVSEIDNWKKFTGCPTPESAGNYLLCRTNETSKYRSAFQALQHLLEAINLTTK